MLKVLIEWIAGRFGKPERPQAPEPPQGWVIERVSTDWTDEDEAEFDRAEAEWERRNLDDPVAMYGHDCVYDPDGYCMVVTCDGARCAERREP